MAREKKGCCVGVEVGSGLAWYNRFQHVVAQQCAGELLLGLVTRVLVSCSCVPSATGCGAAGALPSAGGSGLSSRRYCSGAGCASGRSGLSHRVMHTPLCGRRGPAVSAEQVRGSRWAGVECSVVACRCSCMC